MSKDKELAAVFDPMTSLKEMGIKGIPQPIEFKPEDEEVLELTECADCEGGPTRQVKSIIGNDVRSIDDAVSIISASADANGYTDKYAADRAEYEAGDTSKGMRFNKGKTRYDLLPPEGLEELALIYTMGAEKYAPRNWEKGISLSGCFASLMRHAWAWMRGEDLDPESGLHHMGHVAWNATAIVVFYRRGRKDLDDRP